MKNTNWFLLKDELEKINIGGVICKITIYNRIVIDECPKTRMNTSRLIRKLVKCGVLSILHQDYSPCFMTYVKNYNIPKGTLVKDLGTVRFSRILKLQKLTEKWEKNTQEMN